MEGIPDFKWEMLREFGESVALVCAFNAKHGTLPKPGGKREDGEEGRLASFLSAQRQLHKKGPNALKQSHLFKMKLLNYVQRLMHSLQTRVSILWRIFLTRSSWEDLDKSQGKTQSI